MSTTDNLKKVFTELGLGAEADWKRLSKKKNDAGQWVRMFENKKSGDMLEVVDVGNGKFMARKLTEAAKTVFAAPTSAQMDAADRVVNTIYDFDHAEDRSVIKKAGKALATRFLFAIYADEDDEGGLYARLAPITDTSYDGELSTVIAHLLPGYPEIDEAMGSCFRFDGVTDAVALAKDLLARGFVWTPEFQRDNESLGTGPGVMAALQALASGEPSAAENDAADKVVKKLLEYKDQIPAALIAQAGSALASRFAFAVGGGDDGEPLYAYLAPKGESWDQHLEYVIAHLLPENGGEAMEATFDFSNYSDAVKLVADISKRGFFWDEKMQADFDRDTGNNVLQRVKAAMPTPPSRPKSGGIKK